MPGQFNNNMYENPQMGMKPAPMQAGGMQQGIPMGGQGPPMQGGPQMPPGGFGGQQLQNQLKYKRKTMLIILMPHLRQLIK